MSDTNFSPFPDKGRLVYGVWRKATSVRARPDYARNNQKLTLADLASFHYRHGTYPFVSWNFGFWHGYIGWKPINLEDPGFYWQAWPEIQVYKTEGRLFVQLSARQGVGGIS